MHSLYNFDHCGLYPSLPPLFFTDNPIVKRSTLLWGFNLIAQIFSIEWVNEALENYSFLLQNCLHPYPDAGLYFPVCQNEHDIVVYTLVMSLSTLINYLISYFD